MHILPPLTVAVQVSRAAPQSSRAGGEGPLPATPPRPAHRGHPCQPLPPRRARGRGWGVPAPPSAPLHELPAAPPPPRPLAGDGAACHASCRLPAWPPVALRTNHGENFQSLILNFLHVMRPSMVKGIFVLKEYF